MDEATIPSREDSRTLFQEVLALNGGPAFVRRARRVEEAHQELLERCGRQREEWLAMVRLRLGTLRALVGNWDALSNLVSLSSLATLRHLHDELAPRLRLVLDTTTSHRRLRTALRETSESIERFNRRWRRFLHEQDLTRINELRDGYNRYYVLEKECAVRSPRIAREGFVKLSHLSVDELLVNLPLLPELGRV